MGNIPPAPSHKPPNLSLSLASPSSAEFKSCPSPQRCVPSTPPPQFRPLLSSQLTAQPSWPPAPPLRSVPIHTASKVLFPKRNLATCTLNLFGNSLLQSRLSPRQDWQERHDHPASHAPTRFQPCHPSFPHILLGGRASLCAPHPTWNPPLLSVSSLPTSVVSSGTCPSIPNLAQELLPCAPSPFSYTEPHLLSSHPSHSHTLSSAS